MEQDLATNGAEKAERIHPGVQPHQDNGDHDSQERGWSNDVATSSCKPQAPDTCAAERLRVSGRKDSAGNNKDSEEASRLGVCAGGATMQDSVTSDRLRGDVHRLGGDGSVTEGCGSSPGDCEAKRSEAGAGSGARSRSVVLSDGENLLRETDVDFSSEPPDVFSSDSSSTDRTSDDKSDRHSSSDLAEPVTNSVVQSSGKKTVVEGESGRRISSKPTSRTRLNGKELQAQSGSSRLSDYDDDESRPSETANGTDRDSKARSVRTEEEDSERVEKLRADRANGYSDVTKAVAAVVVNGGDNIGVRSGRGDNIGVGSGSGGVAAVAVQAEGGASDPQPHDDDDHQPRQPFTDLVDMALLLQDLRGEARGDQSGGNAQEQELRALLRGSGSELPMRKHLKKKLRSASWGSASTVRELAWQLICGRLFVLETSGVYVDMEQELFGDDPNEAVPVPVWPQQPAEVEVILSDNYLTATGKNTAHKIVSVIMALLPHVTYCPGLLPLTDLYLHYMSPRDTFSCAFTLLKSNKVVYLTQSRIAFEASKLVLRDLTKRYAKSTFAALVRNSSSIDVVFDNWMSWIYCDLPFNYVVAMSDCYLLEGIKVQYRCVLAILILYAKQPAMQAQIAQPDPNIVRSISDFCRNLPVTPAEFLKVAFRIRGFSRRKMIKLQQLHEGQAHSAALSARSGVPRVGSAQSLGQVSMGVSAAVSLNTAHARLMGFHTVASEIITMEELAMLWSWMPVRHQLIAPYLHFSSSTLGTSLNTLYTKVEFSPVTYILIKTVEDEVFGGFCSEAWYERKFYQSPLRHFGTGEGFLFTLHPERKKYLWVGKNAPDPGGKRSMYMSGSHECLTVGGGDGVGLYLDATMERCRTERCNTFNNPPLCAAGDFTPAIVEVIGHQPQT